MPGPKGEYGTTGGKFLETINILKQLVHINPHVGKGTACSYQNFVGLSLYPYP